MHLLGPGVHPLLTLLLSVCTFMQLSNGWFSAQHLFLEKKIYKLDSTTMKNFFQLYITYQSFLVLRMGNRSACVLRLAKTPYVRSPILFVSGPLLHVLWPPPRRAELGPHILPQPDGSATRPPDIRHHVTKPGRPPPLEVPPDGGVMMREPVETLLW